MQEDALGVVHALPVSTAPDSITTDKCYTLV